MRQDSYCNVYFVHGPLPGKIINGRVSIHSIFVNTVGSGILGDDGKSIALSATDGGSPVIQVALRYPKSAGLTGPDASDVRCYSNIIETGGDGVLFTDGVWLSKPVGPNTNGDRGSIATLSIFYTGGANA